MKNIIVGIHTNEEISEDSKSLMNAFNQLDVDTFTIKECKEKNINPSFAIGFDTEGLKDWQQLLNQGTTNFICATDSVFSQNYEIIKQFSGYKNFILLNTTNADTVPIGKFIPKLTHGYLPIGIDTDFWNNGNKERDIDIAVIGNVIDTDSKIKKLKETMPELVFQLMNEFVNIATINPSMSIVEIFDIVQKQLEFEYTDEQVILFMTELSDIITTKLYEKALSQLTQYNLTFVGNNCWEKHKKDNDKIISPQNSKELKDTLQRTKMALVIPKFSQTGGISSTILKAAASGCMVLTPVTLHLKNEFLDSLAFYNPVNGEGLTQRIKYYLENKEERQEFINIAQKIISDRHTWKHRAKSILDIIQ